MKIALLGGGAFGITLALQLSKKHEVFVYEYVQARVETLKKGYCPLIDAQIPESILISNQMSDVLPLTECVVIAVASEYVRTTVLTAKQYIPPHAIVVLASKGFDESGSLLSKIVFDTLQSETAVLSGPTIAKELSHNVLTAAVIACDNPDIRSMLCQEFSTDIFHCYPSDDMVGVQIGGALKNCIAIWGGIVDGLKLGKNTKSYIMTKGLDEIKLLGCAMGAKPITFYGLSGLGDLIVTCTSENSRNRQLGEKLVSGQKLSEALAEMTMVAEGVHTTKVGVELGRKFNVRMPLIEGLFQILFEGKDIQDTVRELL